MLDRDHSCVPENQIHQLRVEENYMDGNNAVKRNNAAAILYIMPTVGWYIGEGGYKKSVLYDKVKLFDAILQVLRNSMKASEAIPLKTALIACRICEYAAGGYLYGLRKVF